eukprot:COSAG03_NODE_659_length_6400_cov_27.197746_9_plen_79_part_00
MTESYSQQLLGVASVVKPTHAVLLVQVASHTACPCKKSVKLVRCSGINPANFRYDCTHTRARAQSQRDEEGGGSERAS